MTKQPELPDGWRWRKGRAGPDYWQAERLADGAVTACAYSASYLVSEARLLDVACPVRERCHLPITPAEGWPSDLLDAGFVGCPDQSHWLTLPGVHPGLTIAGEDREHTIASARRYLVAVRLAALERAQRPEKPRAPARKAKTPEAPPAAPRATQAPVSAAQAEQMGLGL